MFDKKFLLATSVLIGTIVGAGIFGLPYTITKSGILPGLFYFLILGSAVLLIHLLLGEIVLRTRGKHRLIGYSQMYLGNWGKDLITLSTFLGTSGTLLAYIILGGDFLKVLFSPWLNLNAFYFSLLFGLFLSYFIFRGMKIIAPTEFFTNLIFFVILFIILCFALPKISFQNFTLINLPNIFLPYGIILFALAGWTAIPEIGDILQTTEEKRKYKKAINSAILIAICLYLFFVLTVIGVSGEKTSPDSLGGLTPFLGEKIIFFGTLAAVITLADSFLVIGLYLKNTLSYDYRFPKFWASVVTCCLPLALFLIGFRRFIETIGFVGTLIGVIEGIVIILIFKKAKSLGDRQPEYSLGIPNLLLYFLVVVFILGAISQVVYYWQ